MSPDRRLPPGPWATGVGSLPGTRPDRALDVVLGELGGADLPFLPELPDRGVGADMIGRGAGFLVDLPVDLQPSGWRLVDRPGADSRRAASWWRQDLDALAERGEEVARAAAFKVSMTGPWTLAALLQRQRGEVAVSDPGARRDLVESLNAGAAEMVAAVRRAVPEGSLVVQVDEPSLPAVLLGRVPTASGYGSLRSVDVLEVRSGLRSLVETLHALDVAVVLHCCAGEAPYRTLAETGADAISVRTPVSAAGADAGRWEVLAGLLEAGTDLVCGVVDPLADPPPKGWAPRTLAETVLRPFEELGLGPERLDRVGVSATCGAAGASPEAARAQLTALAAATAVLRDAPAVREP